MKESIILSSKCNDEENARNFYDILKSRLSQRLETTISFQYVEEISEEYLKIMISDLLKYFSIYTINAYVFFDAITLEQSESVLRVLYPHV